MTDDKTKNRHASGLPVSIRTGIKKRRPSNLTDHFSHGCSLRPPCPTRCRVVFDGEQQSFLKLLCSVPLSLEGRRKPVNWLQRHPLIYPIFLTSFGWGQLASRSHGRTFTSWSCFVVYMTPKDPAAYISICLSYNAAYCIRSKGARQVTMYHG